MPPIRRPGERRGDNYPDMEGYLKSKDTRPRRSPGWRCLRSLSS